METKYLTKIKPQLHKLTELFRQGATESHAAEFLGITIAEFKYFRKKYPELAGIFELRNARCDDMVESALLKRATGYEDANGKEVPADVRAAVFWLQNRRPKQWSSGARRRRKSKGKSAVNIQLSADEAEV